VLGIKAMQSQVIQTAVRDVGQPLWLPDGQWRDLDKLSGEAFDARLGEWRRDALLARPLSLKERLRVEKRLTKH
jgi:hypothetical protein